jgi:hypothetical protein
VGRRQNGQKSYLEEEVDIFRKSGGHMNILVTTKDKSLFGSAFVCLTATGRCASVLSCSSTLCSRHVLYRHKVMGKVEF